MSKRIRMLLSLLLTLVIILSMGTVAIAIGAEQEPTTEPTTEPVTEPTTGHTHNWVLQLVRTEYHAFYCKDCHETKQEAHTLDEAEICTVCGEYAHIHNWQRVKADDYFHTIVCSGCQESKTVTHRFDGQCCTVCGYEKHEHIWQYNGEKYDNVHDLSCTKCDTRSSEDHTYGDDGSCTVCGAPPPHICQLVCRYENNRFHAWECDCGRTYMEDHSRVWDGVNRNRECHGTVCNDCGDVMLDVPHRYDPGFVNGERCRTCGYEKVKHSWKYGDSFDRDSHFMVCTHCDSSRFEAHSYNSKGKCKVCGYQDPDAAEQETNPPETKPAGTEPTEEKPEETKPTETTPTEAKPEETTPTGTEAAGTTATEEKPEETTPTGTEAAETTPTEAKPEETKTSGTEAAETRPAETAPAETKPAAPETVPENAAEENSRSMGSPWIWIAAAIAASCGLGATVFFWKKKSS